MWFEFLICVEEEERTHTPWTEGGPQFQQMCVHDGRVCRGTGEESNEGSIHSSWLPGPSAQTQRAPEAAETMRRYRITSFYNAWQTRSALAPPRRAHIARPQRNKHNGASASQCSACRCGFSWMGRRPLAASIVHTTPRWCCRQSHRCLPPQVAPQTDWTAAPLEEIIDYQKSVQISCFYFFTY